PRQLGAGRLTRPCVPMDVWPWVEERVARGCEGSAHKNEHVILLIVKLQDAFVLVNDVGVFMTQVGRTWPSVGEPVSFGFFFVDKCIRLRRPFAVGLGKTHIKEVALIFSCLPMSGFNARAQARR